MGDCPVHLRRGTEVISDISVETLNVVGGKFRRDEHGEPVVKGDFCTRDVFRHPGVKWVELAERRKWSGERSVVTLTLGSSVGVDGAKSCVQSHDNSSWLVWGFG